MNDDELEAEFIELAFRGGSKDHDGDPGQDGSGIHRLGVGGPGIRHVRTAAGATYYGQPLGSVITKDQINQAERMNKARGIRPPKGGLTEPSRTAEHPPALHQIGMPKTPAQQAARAKLQANSPKPGALAERVAAAPPKPLVAPKPAGTPAQVRTKLASAAGKPGGLAARAVKPPVTPAVPKVPGKPPAAAGTAPEKPLRDIAQEIKNIKPTIQGPLTFKVGSKSFSAPEGSKIFRLNENPQGLAFVHTPDGVVHAFNTKNEVVIPQDVQAAFQKRFAGNLKNDPTYTADKFDNAGKVPELGDAKAGATLHEGDSTVFQKTVDGSWQHQDLGTKHQDGELSDAYKSGQLQYKPAGGADLASMDRETFSKTIRSLGESARLQFANPSTGEVHSLIKSQGAWSTDKGKPMSEASLFYLRRNLSIENDPNMAKQVARATRAAAKKTDGPKKVPSAKSLGIEPRNNNAPDPNKRPAARKPAAKTPAKVSAAESKKPPVRREPSAGKKVTPTPDAPKELSGREKLRQATPPHTKAAEDLQPGDRFGGGTIHSVGPHPDEKMQHKVLVHFKDKNGELRRTEWGKRTQIAIHKDEPKKEPAAPEAAKPASDATHKAGRGLGPMELKDLTPGARVRGTFKAPSGSGTGDSETRYYKHWDGSFRHIGEDISPPHTAHEIALHHSGKNRKLVLEEDNKGGHLNHPQVGDDATPAWAKEAQPGHTIVEKHGQFGDEHTNWTKQHDGSWLSDSGEVISHDQVGQGDHWRMAIGPHHDLPHDHQLEHADAAHVTAPHVEKPAENLPAGYHERLAEAERQLEIQRKKATNDIAFAFNVEQGNHTFGKYKVDAVKARQEAEAERKRVHDTEQAIERFKATQGKDTAGLPDFPQQRSRADIQAEAQKYDNGEIPTTEHARALDALNMEKIRQQERDMVQTSRARNKAKSAEPDGTPDVPKQPTLKAGDSIPSTDWMRNAQAGTKVEYVRRDGQRSEYTRINQQEWQSPRGTTVPAAHMEEPRKLSLWRFVSAPSDSHPEVGSAKDTAKQAGTLTAEWFASQPDGVEIERNGQTFLKRDGKWVSKDGKVHGPGDMVNLLNN